MPFADKEFSAKMGAVLGLCSAAQVNELVLHYILVLFIQKLTKKSVIITLI